MKTSELDDLPDYLNPGAGIVTFFDWLNMGRWERIANDILVILEMLRDDPRRHDLRLPPAWTHPA